VAAAASRWGAQTFGRCAPRMPAWGSIGKCAQLMRAATSQDVEIMLGVDGTVVVSREQLFFLVFFFSFTSYGGLEQWPLGISYVQESRYAYHGDSSLFAFY
jgi:hypothetical protein